MKLLHNANLSWRLVKILSIHFQTVEHVKSTGLPVPAKDVEIWEWARQNEYTIVTNDEDFSNISLLKGFPPKVILLRKGNLTTAETANVLIKSLKEIRTMSESSQHGLLEIY